MKNRWAMRRLMITYLISSGVLSIVIILRQASPSIVINFLNLVLYDFFFYIMPAFTLYMLPRLKGERNDRQFSGPLLTVAYLLSAVYLDCCPILPFLLKYFFFFSPFFIFMFLFLSGKLLIADKKRFFVLICIVIIVFPFISAYVIAPQIILSKANSISDANGKILFLSNHSTQTVLSIWRYKDNWWLFRYISLHRFYNDFQKYLFLGVGGCGELASVTERLLSDGGFTVRKVGFVGENHEFLEVYINGSWKVVDPGYRYNLISREERGSLRLKEKGGLSYVVAYTQHGIIELTDYYVPTDTIIIKVTANGEPVANAKVVLKHIFQGLEQSLPEYYTDVNGTVILHLGPTTYDRDLEETEGFFTIFVNDVNTHRKVTSRGVGEIRYIEIELMDSTGS